MSFIFGKYFFFLVWFYLVGLKTWESPTRNFFKNRNTIKKKIWFGLLSFYWHIYSDRKNDRRSWDFQNMIVSDCRSLFGKMIVSDCRSWKKVSCLTLCIHNFWLSSPLWLLLKWMVLVFEKWCRIVVPT